MRAHLLVAASVAILAGHASAQPAPTVQSSFSPQLFHPAPGNDDFVTVESARPLHHLQLAAGLTLDWARNPLEVLTYSSRNLDPYGAKIAAQKNAVSGEVWVGLGLVERLQVALALPMTLYQNGQSYDADLPGPDGTHVRPPSGFALGDLRLYVKGLLYGKKLGPQVAVSYWQGFPTGQTNRLEGESRSKGFAGEGRALFEWVGKRWMVGLNVGFHWQEQTLVYYTAGISQALTYGAAASFDAVRDRLRLTVELFGFSTFSHAIDYTAKYPLELDVSARVFVGHGVSVLAGVGGGVVEGAGAPKPRVFAGFQFVQPLKDRDHDGVPDDRDRCPDVAEDRDGFEDEDGCPDLDDDHDTIRDQDDQCPRAAEDYDGFKDSDGCPDLDNDEDGIPDAKDPCPNDPEDHKAPFPNDGCPATKSDEDNDGVSDAVDKCPKEAEDKDGFQDEDGCPDPDNDEDGIPDDYDQCPNAKEDVDGVDDDDGCPDFKGTIKLEHDDLKLATPIGLDGTRLSAAGLATVDQLAVVMNARSTLIYRIEGYWDKKGDSQGSSQAIADAVKKRLLEKGVAPTRVTAVGYGVVGAPSRRVEVHVVKSKAGTEAAPSQPEE